MSTTTWPYYCQYFSKISIFINFLQRISKEVQAEVSNSAKKTGATFSTAWKWIKVILVMFAIWVLVFGVTIAEGMWRNVSRGWKMLAGAEGQQTA